MNLSLHISKNNNLKDYTTDHHIRFAVIDLDKSKKYPENYICLLPLNLRGNGKSSAKFSEIFGDKSLELAKTLLAKTLKVEHDSEIRAEIKRRLSLLEPKPAVQVKCRVCGISFESRKRGRSRQKICKECKQKMYADQM